ncbi:MAG: hypothetical protein ABSH25_04130, partial [Syntrophorhabdales bacterium]
IAANAAKKSDDIAEETLIITHRPWINVSLGIGSEFAFNEQGGSIMIIVKAKNVGNSPAFSVWASAEVFPWLPDNFAVEQKRIFDRAQQIKLFTPLGYTLFSGEDATFILGLQISEQAIKESYMKQGPEPHFILPIIIGCVSYKFGFNESVHKTGFAMSIRQIDPLNPTAGLAIYPEHGNVPPNSLVLDAFPFAGGVRYAD